MLPFGSDEFADALKVHDAALSGKPEIMWQLLDDLVHAVLRDLVGPQVLDAASPHEIPKCIGNVISHLLATEMLRQGEARLFSHPADLLRIRYRTVPDHNGQSKGAPQAVAYPVVQQVDGVGNGMAQVGALIPKGVACIQAGKADPGPGLQRCV